MGIDLQNPVIFNVFKKFIVPPPNFYSAPALWRGTRVVWGHNKKFFPAFRAGILCPPLWNSCRRLCFSVDSFGDIVTYLKRHQGFAGGPKSGHSHWSERWLLTLNIALMRVCVMFKVAIFLPAGMHSPSRMHCPSLVVDDMLCTMLADVSMNMLLLLLLLLIQVFAVADRRTSCIGFNSENF